jgi:hypothetical protein
MKKKEIKVEKNFNKLSGEADVLPKEVQKAGSIKKKHPVYIELTHATYYTKTKLKGKKLDKYIAKRIEEHEYKWRNLNVHNSNPNYTKAASVKRKRKEKAKQLEI